MNDVQTSTVVLQLSQTLGSAGGTASSAQVGMEPLAVFRHSVPLVSHRLVGRCLLRGLVVVAPTLCTYTALFLVF